MVIGGFLTDVCAFLGEKVIILIAFFWFLINGSRYFLSADKPTVVLKGRGKPLNLG